MLFAESKLNKILHILKTQISLYIFKYQKRNALRLKWKSANALQTGNSRTRPEKLNDILKNARKGQHKLRFLILSMTVSFYISWTPYAIVCILSMLGISTPRLGNILSILFAKTGTVFNPILYIYFNKEVRINATKSYVLH